jgi:hypothetical protein
MIFRARLFGLIAFLAMVPPAAAQDLDLAEDVLGPVDTVFSSYQECLDRKKELWEQAKAKGDEAWELAKAYEWTTNMKPGGSGARALYKAADDLRRAADEIECVYRQATSDSAARLEEAYKIVDWFEDNTLKRHPKVVREIIENSLSSIEKHGLRLMDELETVQASVAASVDSGLGAVPDAAPTQAEVASAPPPALRVPNCEWTGNDIRYIEGQIVCFAPGSRADRFEPTASPDAGGTNTTYKGYGVTVYIKERWSSWEPECAAQPYGPNGECQPEPPTWRDDLSDWSAFDD